jgi:CopG family nickel-responsive transcriptional regulator
MSELIRLSVSIEKPLFEKLERLVAESQYTNRSEFIRDLVRDRLASDEWDSGAESLGTITLVYDHHARGLNARLTDLQHDFRGQVLATTHVHLDHHRCAEMVMVRGRAEDIKGLTDAMHRLKGVLLAKLATGSTGERLT